MCPARRACCRGSARHRSQRLSELARARSGCGPRDRAFDVRQLRAARPVLGRARRVLGRPLDEPVRRMRRRGPLSHAGCSSRKPRVSRLLSGEPRILRTVSPGVPRSSVRGAAACTLGSRARCRAVRRLLVLARSKGAIGGAVHGAPGRHRSRVQVVRQLGYEASKSRAKARKYAPSAEYSSWAAPVSNPRSIKLAWRTDTPKRFANKRSGEGVP